MQCDICYGGGNVHALGCPNTPRNPIYECKTCDEGICEGESYIDTGNGYICKECAKELHVNEIMDIVNWEFSEAERN